MKTNHLLKKWFWRMAVVAIALISNMSGMQAKVWANESGGTTGGADHLIEAAALLPDQLEFSGSHKVDDKNFPTPNLVIGRRRCWGVIKCNIYAHRIEYRLTMSKKEFLQNYGQGRHAELTGRYKKYSRVFGENDENREAQTLLMSARQNIAGLASKVYWDGKELTLREYERMKENGFEVLLSQVNWSDPRTMVPVMVYVKYFETMKFSVGGWYFKIHESLSSRIAAISQELHGILMETVDQQGRCDFQKYDELKQKIKQWYVGSHRFFWQADAILQQHGLESHFFRSASFEVRNQFRQLMEDAVVPFCEEPNAPTGQRALQLLFD